MTKERFTQGELVASHHSLAQALHAYIATADIAEDRNGWLFRASPGYNATVLTERTNAPDHRC